MAIEKKRLSVEEIEAQTALELPDRETLATVVLLAVWCYVLARSRSRTLMSTSQPRSALQFKPLM